MGLLNDRSLRWISLAAALVVVGLWQSRDDAAAPRALQAGEAKGVADAAPPAAEWPVYRGTPRSLGYAAGALPRTPELLWKFAGQDRLGYESPPAIVDGTVYAPSLDGNLYALDLATGKLKWKFNTPLGFRAAPAVADGLVFIGDSDGVFYALDAQTGEKKWSYTTDAEINGSANFYKDTVIFGSQDAKMYCLKRSDGSVVWIYEIEDQIQCGITVADGHAFLAGCDSNLHVIDVATGKSNNKPVPIESPTNATPAVPDEHAYFGTQAGTFFAIDWKDGEVEWTYSDPSRKQPIQSSAAVSDDLIVYGSRGKKLYALNRTTGKEVWTYASRGRIDSSPVIVGDRVYFGTADGRILGLHLRTGRVLWEHEAGGSFVSGPAVADGKLLIGNEEGTLFCFGAKN